MKLMNKFKSAAVHAARTSKLVTYKKAGSGSDMSSSSGDSSSEEEAFTDLKTLQAQGDLPQEFWQVGQFLYFGLLNMPCARAVHHVYTANFCSQGSKAGQIFKDRKSNGHNHRHLQLNRFRPEKRIRSTCHHGRWRSRGLMIFYFLF